MNTDCDTNSSIFSQAVESAVTPRDQGVDRSIDALEKRTNRNLESSNAAIAVHINSLSERLAKVEKAPQAARAWHPKKQHVPRIALEKLQMQFGSPRDDRSESALSGATGGSERENSMYPDVDPDEVDPDERQRHYSDFIAVTEKNMNCVGVLSWSMCRATRQSSTFCGALLGMLPAIVFVLIQCVVLHAISLEALNPTCAYSADCRAGMWCAPSRGLTIHQSAPGKCEDCLWAQRMQDQNFTDVPSWLRNDAYNVMDSTVLAAAVTYCDSMGYVAATDEAERCDYLDKWQNQLTLGPFFVLLAVIAVVLLVVVADLDQDEACTDVFVYRLEQVGTLGCCSRGIIRTFASIVFNIRKFVLPGMVARTYLALVLTGPSGPGLSLPVASVLAGVAVCLVYLADRLFALAFLDESAHAFVREAYGDEVVKMEEEKQDNLGTARSVAYWSHRFYAACLGAMIVVVLLTANTVMGDLYFIDIGSLMFDDGSVKHPEPHNNCTNVAYMLGLISATLVIVCTMIWFMTYQLVYKCGRCSYLDPILAPLVALGAIPVLSSLLSEVVYVHPSNL